VGKKSACDTREKEGKKKESQCTGPKPAVSRVFVSMSVRVMVACVPAKGLLQGLTAAGWGVGTDSDGHLFGKERDGDG
jgi:hypothetical protein